MLHRLLNCLMLVLLVAITSPATAQSCDIERWYCVDGLNVGLDTAPDTLDQTTPRAAIESLIFAARNDDWSAGAHLLNLNALPSDQQAADGPKLIRQLETIIARKTIIDWNNIVDRPDGLDARGPSEDRMAGQARKSILLWTLELEDHPTAIRLNRVKPVKMMPFGFSHHRLSRIFRHFTNATVPVRWNAGCQMHLSKTPYSALCGGRLRGFQYFFLYLP